MATTDVPASTDSITEGELLALKSAMSGEASGFFSGNGPIFVGRSPGRLDVMGGVADYSGSTVLESPIASSALVALQRRTDQMLRVWTTGSEASGISHPLVEWSIPDFFVGESLGPVAVLHASLVSRDVLWVGYILGCFHVLLSQFELTPYSDGADILVRSTVPIAAGVSSSAALEVATMSAIEAAYGLELGGMRFARLCQTVEHQVVGAPCGIMDQVACALGRAGSLVALRCQPHDLLGHETIPDGCSFVGIDSGVKHSVGAGLYARARVGAFMALKVATDVMDDSELDGYLCNVTPPEFRGRLFDRLPARVRGRDFLDEYGETDDPVTRIDPAVTYSPRACAEHAIYENHRVVRFAAFLGAARDGDAGALASAGRLMYGSHWSYGSRIALGCRETDLIVRLARAREGVLGARITGGGSGGTVALMLSTARAIDADQVVAEITREYAETTGLRPRVIRGTSPGAREWGTRVLD